MAAGTLRACAGLAAGGGAVALALAAALIASRDGSLTLTVAGAALLSLGFASANAGTILAFSALRAPTVAIVLAIATGWTAGGLPLWAAAPATLLTGLALAADRRAPGGDRIGSPRAIAGFAVAATILLTVAAATAHTHPGAETPALTTAGGVDAVTTRGEDRVRPAGANARGEGGAAPADAGPAVVAPEDAAPADAGPALVAPADAAPADAGPALVAPADAAPADARPALVAPADAAPAPVVTAAPDSPAAPKPAAPAADYVRAYYAALDGRRFKAAWTLLPAAIRTRFGGFAKWRAGYASTLESRPVDIRVQGAPGGAVTVHHTLIARDRSACGAPIERRFSVTWRLVPSGGGLAIASISATALDPAPHRPCP